MLKIKLLLSKSKNYFIEYFPWVAVIADLLLLSVFYALVVAYVPTQNGDNIEHVHSSFLIAQGQVPYRDFFQHHNPLLWYIFAPLTKLFAYDSTIIEILCLISFFLFLKSLVYVYRIASEFICDKFWGVMAAALAAIPGTKLYAIDFRPDNYMVFCLMGGIYYYFCYLRDKKCPQLVGAFCFFFFSFMFAQKAVFPLSVLGCTGIYFWYKKEILTKDMFKALIIPFIGSGLFLGYLIYYDMVKLYYVANYTFNLNLVNGFEMFRISVIPQYMKWLFLLGWIGALFSLFVKNKYLRILALMFAIEFIQRRFYFSPYYYYYWLAVYFASLCAIAFLQKFNQYLPVVCYIVIFWLYFCFYQSGVIYYNKIRDEESQFYLPDFITRQISPCDYVFNGDGLMYNIFGRDPSYYWQLIGQLDVIGEQTGLQPKPNINQLIEELKPKVIFGKSYFNKFSSESGKHEIVHYVDRNLIKKYYKKTEFGTIYILKSKYQRTCKKDPVTGKWEFVD